MNEHYYKVGLVILIGLSCLTLGVLLLYAHTIMPGLKKLDDVSFVRSFQSIDRAIVNPFFMAQFFVPLFLFAGLYLYARSQAYAEASYLLVGGVAYLAVIVLTMAVNVPLNDGIKRVNPQAGTDALSQARAAFNESRWAGANLARTVANAGAVVLAAVALLVHK